MSRTRVADGSDEHGRPKGRWTEAEPVTTPYGFMEPAIPPTIERRKATDEEMAAARAREDEPGHLTRPSLGTPPLLVGRIREEPEPPMIDELHQWRRMPTEADFPTVQPADRTPAQLPADADPIDPAIATIPRHRGLISGDPVDKRPLHEVVDRWRARHGVIEEPCVCGGPYILAASGSDWDVVAAVRRHQIEPVHIAYDRAHGIPWSEAQRRAAALDMIEVR